MTTATSRRSEERAATIAGISADLASGETIRRTLPDGGRLHVDRPLPFLCLDRNPEVPGETSLVTGEAAYLRSPVSGFSAKVSTEIVRALALRSQARFGGSLLFEVLIRAWSPDPDTLPIRILTPEDEVGEEVGAVLARYLRRVGGLAEGVELLHRPRKGPFAGPKPLLSRTDERSLECRQITIEIEPRWRGAEGVVYPAMLRRLRRGLGVAIQQAAYLFARDHSSHSASDVHSLGRRKLVKAVWAVDEQLSKISSSYDFLLCVTPINGEAAWTEFSRSGFEKAPRLRYRPLPIDPSLSKRQLFKIPIERIEDPTLSELFSEKQAEIDRQLTMLHDRGTPRFLFGSQAAYGACSRPLVRHAEDILENISATARARGGGERVGAAQFAARAEEELAWYREQSPTFAARVEIRMDTLGSLMVSRGRLLIPKNTHTPAGRVDALLQHEIGTHLVTWHNGSSQRLSQLAHGLAGYEELQEGLAVLAEYLVGGMTPARLRTLAGRVLVSDAIASGASFVDSFRLLRRCGWPQRLAFSLVVRVYRGGGFTKDMIYLRGLLHVLSHLAGGGALEPLYIGKIGTSHISTVHELCSRHVLTPPDCMPRYLSRPEVVQRLTRLRQGIKLHELVERAPKPS